jgi:hypothetical protein
MDADMASISSRNAMHDTESNLDNTPLLNQEASMFDGVQNISDTASALGSPTESALESFSMVGSRPLFNYTNTLSSNSVRNPLGKHHPQPYQYQQREFRRDPQLHRASLTKKKPVRFHSRTTVYPAQGPRPLIFAPNRAKRLPTSPSLISKAVLSTRVVSGFFINGKGRAQTSIIDRVIATNWAPSTSVVNSQPTGLDWTKLNSD